MDWLGECRIPLHFVGFRHLVDECFPDEQNSGDSYTSTVFNIHGEQPNPGNPLGNPPYPGSTSSGGPNYVDYLTTTYNESYIQTYNLGFGGGTVDHLLLPSTFSPNVLSFDQQVQQEFIPTYGDQVAVPWSAANSLVTIFFGINDVLLALPKHNDSLNCAIIKSYENLVHQVRLTICAFIDEKPVLTRQKSQQLYDTGLRNFVFMNVPPLDRDPGSLHQDANYQASLAHDIGVWNFRLQNVANNLAANFPESTVFQFDTNWLFTLVLNDPTSFPETSGFLNTTGACKAYLQSVPFFSPFFSPCPFSPCLFPLFSLSPPAIYQLSSPALIPIFQ